jgi:LL-diaminopimelate aminotransferase
MQAIDLETEISSFSPRVANRLEGISEYYFATKLREIALMNQNGLNVINLGIGSPDMAPAPEVLAALHTSAQNPRAHGYQSYTGIPALRKAWADFYKKYYRVHLNPDGEILPLIGSKEGILHISMTYLQEGDEVLVPNPGYPTYRAASMLAGAKVVNYNLKEANQWQPDLAALEQTDLSNVRIMWVNYPQMPTGAAAQKSVFEEIINFGRKHNVLIVNDNPYSFILNDHPQSILEIDGADGIAMELNSLSKSHNLAGWRIGALLGNAHLVKNVLRFKSNMDSGQPLPLQEAAIHALNLGDDWHKNLNEIYKKRQQKAFELLDLMDCKYDPKQQGLFVWAKITNSYSDCYALSDKVLYGSNVFITPGGIFGSEGERYVRISLCQEVSVFEEAIERVIGL